MKSAGLWKVSQQAGHLGNSSYRQTMTLKSLGKIHFCIAQSAQIMAADLFTYVYGQL